jgi:hypothetical protein
MKQRRSLTDRGRPVGSKALPTHSWAGSPTPATLAWRHPELVEEHFKFQQDRVKVRKSHMKKFKKVLSGKQLARFYQIDGKIDTMIDFDIARAVPLVN